MSSEELSLQSWGQQTNLWIRCTAAQNTTGNTTKTEMQEAGTENENETKWSQTWRRVTVAGQQRHRHTSRLSARLHTQLMRHGRQHIRLLRPRLLFTDVITYPTRTTRANTIQQAVYGATYLPKCGSSNELQNKTITKYLGQLFCVCAHVTFGKRLKTKNVRS